MSRPKLHLLTVLLVMQPLCSSCTAPAPRQSNAESPQRKTESKSNSSKSMQTAGAQPERQKQSANNSELSQCVESIADRADQTVEDGWFYGHDPRNFKSFYRKVTAARKAEFAMAYHDFIAGFNQDLVKDFASYVPYSKRSDFAFEWWQKKEPRFKTMEKKMQVLFAHESIQDAGELYFRACQQLGKTPADSMLALAHDEEQRMLAQFMEKEGSPGCISEQIWKRSHSKKANEAARE